MAHCDVMVVWWPDLPHKLLRGGRCGEVGNEGFSGLQRPVVHLIAGSKAMREMEDMGDNRLFHINPGIARDLDMNTTNQAQRRLCVPQSSGMIGILWRLYRDYRVYIYICIHIHIHIHRGYIRIIENGYY